MIERTTLEVHHAEDHEDGSATYTVHAPKETLTRLFSAFFQEAIIRGIEATEADNQRWSHTQTAIKAATKLEALLQLWEAGEDFDYHPTVRNAREELSAALNELALNHAPPTFENGVQP